MCKIGQEEEVQAGALKAEESVDEGGGGPKCCGVFCIKGGAGKSNDEVMHVLGDNPGVVMHLLGKAETGYPTTTVDKGGDGGGGASGGEGRKGKPTDEGATGSEGRGASGGEREEENFDGEEGAG
eukprot:jgi/Undpi1/7316/HiC_scaffold_22.g09789.m1